MKIQVTTRLTRVKFIEFFGKSTVLNFPSLFYFSCPYFRNEVGGELERSVALSRALPKRDSENQAAHMPSSARGFNLMDSPDSFWKNGYCPYESNVTNGQYVIERIDSGATFYKNHFYGQGMYSCPIVSL